MNNTKIGVTQQKLRQFLGANDGFKRRNSEKNPARQQFSSKCSN